MHGLKDNQPHSLEEPVQVDPCGPVLCRRLTSLKRYPYARPAEGIPEETNRENLMFMLHKEHKLGAFDTKMSGHELCRCIYGLLRRS